MARLAAEDEPEELSALCLSPRFDLDFLDPEAEAASLASSRLRSFDERATREPPKSADAVDCVERVRFPSPTAEVSCFLSPREESATGADSPHALSESILRLLRETLLGSGAAGSAARFRMLRPLASLPPSSILCVAQQKADGRETCRAARRQCFVELLRAQKGATPCAANGGNRELVKGRAPTPSLQQRCAATFQQLGTAKWSGALRCALAAEKQPLFLCRVTFWPELNTRPSFRSTCTRHRSHTHARCTADCE